ncbi:MAG TPA: polysaccharide biosynthesis tyrosine autokinase [Candidatus Binatia bacterium]|nr:polysaccharide biosynthesis tyrosine autokinase [Candidatus Binatia bacterium]
MSDFIEVRQIVAIVLRRWWLILLGLVVGGALGFFLSRSMRPVYEATATLLVGQSIQATNLQNSDIQVGERLALTYAALGTRQPVLAGAVDELNLDMSWQQLKKRVHISPVAGTQLLEISVESTSPAEARVIADEIARQMILLSPSAAPTQQEEDSQSFLEDRLESLRLRIENGQQRIEELEDEMAVIESAADLRSRQSEVDSLEQMITGWESNYAQLLTLVDNAEGANQLTLMEAAEANRNPIRPRLELNTFLAGMVGLALALGAVIVIEYMDDTIKAPEEVQRVLGLTPLGEVGQISGRDYAAKLINSQGPFSPTSEAFNIIRSNIRFLSEDGLPGGILITSAAVGEGKSLCVANLGLAMAKAGYSTVIVDADLRRPTQDKIFDVSNESGVAQLLRAGSAELDGYLSATGVESLWLLTSGKPPEYPSELLGSDEMELLLANLVDKFEMVILDSPPLLSAADAAVMSNLVDAVVVVLQAGRTKRHEARRGVTALQQAGANILGVVLNQASARAQDYRYTPYAPKGRARNGRGGYLGRLLPSNASKRGPRDGINAAANGKYDRESISNTEL